MAAGGVSDGQLANESTFDGAFMFRNEDTDTIGRVSLLNALPESGPTIANAQKYINLLAENDGTASESDTTGKNYLSTFFIANGDSRKTAIGKLDTQLKSTQDDLDALEIIVEDHEIRLTDLESNDMTIDGLKTFSGDTTFLEDVIIQGSLTVNGTLTAINTTELEVEDAFVTINKNGTDGTANGAGIEVERPSGNAALVFDPALASFWKIGLSASLREIIVSGVAQVISGLKSFVSGIATDTVSEVTSGAGVTVDGVLLKDGLTDGRDVSVDGASLDSHIANTSNPHSVTKTQVGLSNVTNDAQLKRSANDFSSFTQKTTPAPADLVLIEDSAASGVKKWATVQSLQGSASTVRRSHNFKLNGVFNKQGVPLNAQDGLFRFDVASTIVDFSLAREIAGSSGTTEVDIQIKPPAGAWTSIFSTKPAIGASAGAEAAIAIGGAGTGLTAPVFTGTINVVAGTLMRCNLTSAEAGDPNGLTAQVMFTT